MFSLCAKVANVFTLRCTDSLRQNECLREILFPDEQNTSHLPRPDLYLYCGRCVGRCASAPLRTTRPSPRRWTPWTFRPPRASALVVIVTCGPSRPAVPKTTTRRLWTQTRPRQPPWGAPTLPTPVSIPFVILHRSILGSFKNIIISTADLAVICTSDVTSTSSDNTAIRYLC